jgi:hypothetical protein
VKTVALISILACAVVFMFSAFSSGKFAPNAPDNIFHNSVIKDTACRACHTPGSRVPLKGTHPAREDCLSCHKCRGAA